MKNKREELKNYFDEVTRQNFILKKENYISRSLFPSLEFRRCFFKDKKLIWSIVNIESLKET